MSVTKPRSHRWWLPIAIVLLAFAAILGWSQYPELPIISRIMYSMLTVAISLLLLLGWFLFLTAFRWRTRLLTLGILVLVGFGVSRLIHIDGSVNGSGAPRVTWRWTPRSDGQVVQTKVTTNRLAAVEIPAAPLDYPGFLGSDRGGVVTSLQLERDWIAHPPQLVWRQPVGLGWSSFAVKGSRAVTQEQRGENELVVCYELTTGAALWFHTNHVRFSEKMGGDGPRATPTIEGDRVFVVGATGILDCLELANGKLVWSHDTLIENHASNLVFGKSSSPLVLENLVIVSGGQTNGPMLLAYRRDNGSPVWTSGKDEASYSSPTVATVGGKREVLSLNAASLTAHDPTDGHIEWQYAWKGWGPRCAQPLVFKGDRVLLSAGFGLGSALLKVSTDTSGKCSATEVWKNLRLKTQFASAVIRDGYAYGLDEGVLACIDLATGERKWKDGHYGFGQLVLVQDLLLVQTEPGPIVLVEANPAEFREVSRIDALNSKTWNNPALAGNFLLVRNDQEAICFKLPRGLPAGTPLQSYDFILPAKGKDRRLIDEPRVEGLKTSKRCSGGVALVAECEGGDARWARLASLESDGDYIYDFFTINMPGLRPLRSWPGSDWSICNGKTWGRKLLEKGENGQQGSASAFGPADLGKALLRKIPR